MTSILSFTLNNEPIEIAVKDHFTLLEVLRYVLRYTGTKQGCDKGDCGACMVLLNDKPVLSCLTLAKYVQGKSVLTVEGLAQGKDPHEIQKAFHKSGAAQCGFCTPGMLMAAYSYLENCKFHQNVVTQNSIKEALSSNLCRCTGYTKIFEAVENAAKEMGLPIDSANEANHD